MDLIEEFLARYRKEYDYYDQVARLVAQVLESDLQAAGIRSMVTSRAKGLARLEAKLHQRADAKKYSSIDDIYDDIVDLAGARIAMYFPAEDDQVGRLIRQRFVIIGTPKSFPDGSPPPYDKRFSGYRATHYRVQLQESSLSETQKRYAVAEAKAEIQVASVLMHAWAEVEHDLVYKPLQGSLSQEEYAILDELNGLMLAGEIALERLQKAGESRVAAGGRPFSNHYDLAAHLLDKAGEALRSEITDSVLGRVDLLFEMLGKLDKKTPDHLDAYIKALHADLERRPIAEQIIDQLLAEDESRYPIYEQIRARHAGSGFPLAGADERIQAANQNIVDFLAEWTRLERLLREFVRQIPDRQGIFLPSSKAIEQLGLLDPATRGEFDRIRRLRNNLVHGVETPDPADLREAVERLRQITQSLETQTAAQTIAPADTIS